MYNHRNAIKQAQQITNRLTFLNVSRFFVLLPCRFLPKLIENGDEDIAASCEIQSQQTL
jgi:hypothetical protein